MKAKGTNCWRYDMHRLRDHAGNSLSWSRNRIDISSNADLVAHLMAEVGRYSTEKQKVMEHSAKLGPRCICILLKLLRGKTGLLAMLG